jgi:hypothetical protein
MTDNLHFASAWQGNDPKFEADAVAMWKELRVLPPDVVPEQRAKELVSLAYVGERLVGITTAQIQFYQPVRQKFAFIRILMRPEVEKAGISVPLTIACRETLREWSAAHPEAGVAGYAAIVTAAGYGAKPVLPAGLVLAGYTPQGQQIRLYWWDHFRLPV